MILPGEVCNRHHRSSFQCLRKLNWLNSPILNNSAFISYNLDSLGYLSHIFWFPRLIGRPSSQISVAHSDSRYFILRELTVPRLMKRKPKFFFEEYLLFLEDHESLRGFASWMFLDHLIIEEPTRAWPLILELLERALSEDILENIAAGHLEDFFKIHPTLVVDELTKIAASNERLRRILYICWLPQDSVLRAKIEAINEKYGIRRR